jgi:hypothetical protein
VPSIYFQDSVDRAAFVADVAAELEIVLQIPVRGINLSNPSAIREADFAIIDGPYFSESRTGTPLLSSKEHDAASDNIGLIAQSDGPTDLAAFQDSALILPRVGHSMEGIITGELLLGEITAGSFFGEILYTANIESAISAVQRNRAMATLGNARYAEENGLVLVITSGQSPTPVLSQINPQLSDRLVERVISFFSNGNWDGEISGFSTFREEFYTSFHNRNQGQLHQRHPISILPPSPDIPSLSTYISNPGEHLILLPNATTLLFPPSHGEAE